VFAAYLAVNLDRWLLDRYRTWSGHERIRHPLIVNGFVPLTAAVVARLAAVTYDDVDSPAALELAQLPKRTVRIALMVDAGMKKQDIAAELGVSPQAVSQALRFGRERIESYRRTAA
jgi:DNA-binding NarL/FixJ family response regulator